MSGDLDVIETSRRGDVMRDRREVSLYGCIDDVKLGVLAAALRKALDSTGKPSDGRGPN
jgi:hypothetical protein